MSARREEWKKFLKKDFHDYFFHFPARADIFIIREHEREAVKSAG